MSVMDESAICPVCEHQGDTAPVARLSDRRKGLSGRWDVVRCGACDSQYMTPTPSDEALTEYYSAYTSDSEVVLVDGLGTKQPLLRRAYHWLSGDVDPRDFVSIPAGGKVLDYGSGGGTYLSYFHSRGVDIVGAEISEVMIDACSKAGLRLHRVHSFDDIPFPDAEFDVVYLMQVFEHLRRPRRFMQELGRVLKPGGVLYLALPNADSAWRRIFGANWVSGWFAPFHLVHYTEESLARLAAEYGLTVVSSWSRTPESWFRLNLKAALYRDDQRVEAHRSLIDSVPSRLVLMCLLRLTDVFLRKRDCLVMSFRKVQEQ